METSILNGLEPRQDPCLGRGLSHGQIEVVFRQVCGESFGDICLQHDTQTEKGRVWHKATVGLDAQEIEGSVRCMSWLRYKTWSNASCSDFCY